MASPHVLTPPAGLSRRVPNAPAQLVRALRDEHAVLEDLVETLDRQRKAVARDDIDAVNDTVFAAHRLLAAYREARSRRKSAVIVACGGGEGRVEDLPHALGDGFTEIERKASEDLRSAARRLVAAVDMNRQLLQSAMSSGDAFLRVLTGGAAAPQAYAPATRAAGAAAAAPRLMDLRG